MRIATGATGYHSALVQQPAAPVPNGDGSFTRTWADADPPTWPCALESATAGGHERPEAGSAITSATLVMRGRYRRDISTATRLVIDGHTFAVTAVDDLNRRGLELRVTCEELQS